MYHGRMNPHCERVGEHAWLLHLGDAIDPATSLRVQRAYRALHAAHMGAVEDMIPAYASILLRLAADTSEARVNSVRQRAREILADLHDDDVDPAGATHRIAVCYDGSCAPDMPEVERVCGLSREQIVELHCGTEYRVAMIGFAPGFAYLLGMDERLNVPRRAQPRTRVPAGSVAIGGAQTGIYPRALPGGWQLIGRTPQAMFDASDARHPCRLAAGDRVRFEPINAAEFAQMQAASAP